MKTTYAEAHFQVDRAATDEEAVVDARRSPRRTGDNHRPDVLPEHNWRPRYHPPRRRPIRDALIAAHYWLAQRIARFVTIQTLKFHIINREAMDRTGPYVLAITHVSHLEPFLIGLLLNRRIDFVARLEFYRWWIFRFFLHAFDCIPVHRFGVPVSTIRTSLDRLKAGRIVGIFPEGGVATGSEFVCRGGFLRRGACLISRRANVPIIPVVILGSHALNAVMPWVPFKTIPFKRTPLWVAFGNPIEPRLNEPHSKMARELQAADLQAEYRRLYSELLERFQLRDADIP